MSNSGLKTVFMGTPAFAIPTLKALIQSRHTVRAVVTQPDRRAGRGRRIHSPPVKCESLKHDIPLFQPERIDLGVVERIGQLCPDVVVVAAFGQRLPQPLLKVPPLGCINVHASLLPKYRGPSPINWALIRGEEKTGVTTMMMDEGIDTGDILLQEETTIQADDDALTIHDRLSRMGATCLVETLERLREAAIEPIPQDPSQATHAPLLKKEDGRIDWSQKAVDIFNRVRGLTPWPGAFTSLEGKTIKILRARVLEDENGDSPGRIWAVHDNGIAVATGERSLLVLDVQPQDRRKMNASEFIRGRRIGKDTYFE
jgi:methionyl-tRNA formyltransferase